MASVAELCGTVIHMATGGVSSSGPTSDVLNGYYREMNRRAADEAMRLVGGLSLDHLSVDPKDPSSRQPTTISVTVQLPRLAGRLPPPIRDHPAVRPGIYVDLLQGRDILHLPANRAWKTRVSLRLLFSDTRYV